MTERVLVADPLVHRKHCLCGGAGQVALRREPWSPLLGPVIDCPQCTGSADLEYWVSSWERPTPTAGGAA